MDKQHILNEIRRTAMNGKALGQIAFSKETGIKNNDWLGKYWARWGDALSEAGYQANDWNRAHDKVRVLTNILALTRKLERYPARAEMQLERRINPDFPSSGAIFRLGSKADLLEQLLEYCRKHSGYGDVEHILQATSIPLKPIKPDETTSIGQSGTVYLILAGGHYKIGFTTALYRRASQIANGHPNGAELIHSFETDDPRGIEAYWHNRFADLRVKGINIASGEWFDLSKSDVAAFCKRKRFM